MNSKAPTWLLIDGNNHVHRDFHASGGVASEVLTLLGRRLEAMRRKFDPERIVVALDSDTSFRSDIEPEYKANRPDKPESLRSALGGVRAVCWDEEIDVVEVAGFEADDCLATLTCRAREIGRRVILSSADKDLRQLLERDGVTQLLSVARNRDQLKCTWMTEDNLLSRFGVRSDQWIDYQTMCGDPGDNVVGAPGIGDKTAATILQHCDSLDRYYADVWRAPITAKQRAILSNFRARMELVRSLVTLRQDVPLPAGWMEAVA